MPIQTLKSVATSAAERCEPFAGAALRSDDLVASAGLLWHYSLRTAPAKQLEQINN